MIDRIAVIIVTHNSQAFLHHCLHALEQQTCPPADIILVDSGSTDTEYLQRYSKKDGVTVFQEENIGFSRANNLGYQFLAQNVDYILFLNPDAFPAANSFKQAL
ncbi:MAG: glycosyltransferase, partial [Candidatus Electrothrix sp. AR3]|nr:glycosyltransferase [Candidatus Electrothrix sp. AR3]